MQQIKIKKRNDITIKEIKIKNTDKRPVKGLEIMPLNSNMLIAAKTASGKTTVIATILEQICTEETQIVAFVSTLFNDDKYTWIQEWAEREGIVFHGYTSIKENGIDQLEIWMEKLKQEAIAEKKKKEIEEALALMPIDKHVIADEDDDEEKKKPSKYQSSKYVFIFDDLASEIGSKEYSNFMRVARHYKCSSITSTQYIKDVKPGSKRQYRVFLLFKGLTPKQLIDTYELVSSHLPYPLFDYLYKKATTYEDYSFFYCAPEKNDYRIKFDKDFDIASENKKLEKDKKSINI